MSLWEIFLLAVGVSMDAFSVSIGKGLSVKKVSFREVLSVCLWFGGFQMLMPAAGYLLGTRFSALVDKVDHWIAFSLLLLIGANMIREAFGADDDHAENRDSFSFRTMLTLAVATSIDALALGVSFALIEAPVGLAIGIIGLTTAVFSAVGLLIGKWVGCRFHKGAEIFGGAVLILIGLRILTTHLG